MPFVSPAGSRRAAGGLFSDSILPSLASKSKSRKPPRRRGILRDLLFQNIFAVGLTVSFLLLLFIVFRYGIPNPLSSSSGRAHRIRRTAANRKPSLPERAAAAPGEPLVDITTKDLYDKIQFLDIDGGPWKQGWKVNYQGNEWDSEKLKVFVVPHSHNDPGWKMTVEEYYNFQSKHILDAIVESLSGDIRRKFIWEEMSYLERWWRDASESKREGFIKLVKNGQLEIVGGGWVMNDEANSHYFAIIEQMMEGNMWLNNTIGVVPKNAWAIDPFGYSATMAYLLRRMGFRNMLIQRTHYEVKKELALHKNLEYVWRQSWDMDETTDIFVHMMPFYSYDVPHTCGPEPAVCCQFDFARMPAFRYEACPWHEYPVETTQENVKERALLLLDQYRKKSTLYRTNTLLVPLGDDFRYTSTAEAEAQFRNYQMLFDYINSNPSLNAEAKFGTLDDYFQTLRDEAERINFTRPGEVGSSEIGGFPSLSGDFFTYADRQQDYWSGYYVSRPFFKAVDRVLEQTLRAAEILMTFMLGYCQRSHCSKFPLSFSHKLTAARRNLALFQHHDGVTGTAKNHVVEDYGTRMHTSLQDLLLFMAKSVDVLLTVLQKSDPIPASPSIFEPEQVRSRFDVQPVHRVINVPEGNVQSVVFFNPTEQTREEIVMVIVENPDVSVLLSNWSCVKSQLLPELQYEKDKIFTGRHRLYWQATVSPLGLETYYVANGFIGCEKAIPSKLSVSSNLRGPAPYSSLKLSGHTAEIRNAFHTLSFDLQHGLLHKVTSKGGKQTLVEEEIGFYSSRGSGAYLFKPIGDAVPIVQASGQVVISEGALVQEVFSIPKTTWEKTPVSHSTRIFNGENSIQGLIIEKEYHVELLNREFNDKELIVRFKTDIGNNRVFYTDLNGFQMSRRETYDKIPLQGNYYPMPSLAFLQDAVGRRFSVHSRQALGAASLGNGWLEIMLDRRLVNDDGRGLGQGVMDNRPMNVIFHLLTEVNISSSNSTSTHLPLNPSLLSYRVGAQLNYPMHAFIAKKPVEISLQSSAKDFSPLLAPLPCDLHIVSLKVPQTQKYSHLPGESRFAIILQRRKWDPSYCHRGGFGCTTLGEEPINLFSIFKDLEVLNAKPTSLNLLHDDMEILGYIEQIGEVEQDGHFVVSPMELQAYKLEIRPQQQR